MTKYKDILKDVPKEEIDDKIVTLKKQVRTGQLMILQRQLQLRYIEVCKDDG